MKTMEITITIRQTVPYSDGCPADAYADYTKNCVEQMLDEELELDNYEIAASWKINEE